MEISRISSKGQVTIPKRIREALKLSEGDRVAFIQDNGKAVIAKASLLVTFAQAMTMALEMLEQQIMEQSENECPL